VVVGDGLCLFAKRLERGRFTWPKVESGTIALTRAQLSMLLEGVDWRRPLRTHTPELSVEKKTERAGKKPIDSDLSCPSMMAEAALERGPRNGRKVGTNLSIVCRTNDTVSAEGLYGRPDWLIVHDIAMCCRRTEFHGV
jgi:hypothetical protein